MRAAPNEFAARNRNLADGLSEMAERWRGFEAANEEYEERAAVKEYAETPYLYASKADASDQANSEMLAEYRGDAKEEYERAQAAVDAANARLKQAGYAVQTQDDLEEFNAIVTAIDAGTTFPPLDATAATRLLELRDRKFNSYETLNAAEEVELTTLTRREMYTRYADLIDTQAEHIKHTMRMIRLHKASEIVNAEIMRLRAVSDEKQKKFEDELGKTYGNFTDGNAETARNGVYLRLGNLVENNGSFFREFRGWYYGATDFVGEAAQAWGTSTSNVQGGVIVTYTMRQILEAATGHMDKNSVNATDKSTIGAWMSYGGSMSEFGQFSGTYFGFLMSIGAHDKAELTYQIMRNIYGGMAGSLLYGGAARAKINTAKMQWEIAVISMAASLKRSMDQASKASTMRVMNMQKEYEDSLAKLYYFTHIPDLATFKDRMIKYGVSNRDDDSTEALFQILENQNEFGEMVNDLRYLRDEKSGYVNSNGSTYTPDAEEADNTLDVSSKLEKTEYRDALGRRYDPATLRSSPPGPIEGGFYRGNDGLYTRIVLSRPDRSTYYAYAKTQPDTDPKQDVYDMGKVLEMMVNHGTAIRNDRLAQYANAGEATAAQIQDKSFVLSERDQTYQFLFEQAAGHRVGGREFSGYRLTYEDYNANSAEVFNNELTQREQIQKKEWDLRQQELNDRYQAWEARIATIMERGKKSWDGAESRFLQSQRQWNREFDQKEAEGRKVWDEKIKEHFTKKKNWEDETRQNASETTIQRVLSEQVQKMNSQLAAAAVAMNVDIQQINMTAAINEAIQEMRNELPSGSERLKEINASIAKFSSKLSIAELTGADFLNTALSVGTDFEDTMKEHQRRMKILTNVKIFEQYRTMSRSFEESIDDQNQAVDDRTSADAFQAGFVRNGGIFVKQGDNTRGIVHAYKWFDVRGALKAEKAKAGFAEMEGDELIGFLENRNEVEVEAFFYTQKLALQAAIERIQGRGNAPSGSRDPNEIGLFNEWKGDTGNGMMRDAMTRGAGNSAGGMSADNKAQVLDIATAGFGELGARSQRPGGAPLGFYPELEYMAKEMAKQDAAAMPKGNILTDTLGAFNVMEMYENVEIGSRVNGTDRGKMINAQLTHVAKNVGKVAGTIATTVGTIIAVAGNVVAPGVSVAVGLGIAAAGAALIAVSNATNVDVKTGETSMKMTDQVAIQSVIEIGAAVAAGFTAGSAAMVTGSGVTSISGAIANSAVENMGTHAAIQGLAATGQGAFKFNEKGQSQGTVSGRQAELALSRGLVAAGTSVLGNYTSLGNSAFSSIGNAAISSAIGDAAEYGQYKVFGEKLTGYSQYGSGPGIGIFGNIAVSSLVNSSFESISENAWEKHDEQKIASAAEEWSKDANNTAEEQAMLDAMRGGAIDDRRRAFAQYQEAQANKPRFSTSEAAKIAMAAYEANQDNPRLSGADRREMMDMFGREATNGQVSNAQLVEMIQSMGADPAVLGSAAFVERYNAHTAAGQRADANWRNEQAQIKHAQEVKVWLAEHKDYELVNGQIRLKLDVAAKQFEDTINTAHAIEMDRQARTVTKGDIAMSALSLTGSAVEVGVGTAIMVGAGWTGIGAVAGGALMVHGAGNIALEGHNMYRMLKTGVGNQRDYDLNGSVGGEAMGLAANATGATGNTKKYMMMGGEVVDGAVGLLGGGAGALKSLTTAGRLGRSIMMAQKAYNVTAGVAGVGMIGTAAYDISQMDGQYQGMAAQDMGIMAAMNAGMSAITGRVMKMSAGGGTPVSKALGAFGDMPAPVGLRESIKVNKLLKGMDVDESARRAYFKTKDLEGLAGWMAARDIEVFGKVDISPEQKAALRNANTHEKFDGHRLAPIGHSGFDENLQRAIMESIDDQTIAVMRDRAYAYPKGPAKQIGEKTLEVLELGNRKLLRPDGTIVEGVSDLDPFAFTDLKGNLLSNADAIEIMKKIERNFQMREHGHYDENIRYVFGGHGDQVNGEWGRWPGTQEVKSRNEIVYAFSNRDFLFAEHANSFKSKMPLQIENRQRAMLDRLKFEIEKIR